MHEGGTDAVRGWEGYSEGTHDGALKEVRGWEGDRRVCMREQQMK